MLGIHGKPGHLVHENSLSTSWHRYSEISGLLIAVAGLLFCVGWLLDIESLKRVIPGTASMKFNTALCFALLGYTQYCFNRLKKNNQHFKYLYLLPAAALAISLLTLLEFIFNMSLGIDQLLIDDNDLSPLSLPGRMSSGTALNFAILALVFLTVNRATGKALLPIQIGILYVTISSGSVLLGYIYGVQIFQVSLFASMALHTSILFVVMGFSLIFYTPGLGFMREVTSPHTGGKIARASLPVVILLPVFLGWLSLEGLSAGWYSVEYGFAIKTISNILIMAFLLWIGARTLNMEEQRFSTIVESAPTAMVMINDDGDIQLVNQLTEKLFGYKREEILNQPIEVLLPARFRDNHPALRKEFSRHPEPRSMGTGRDLYGLHKDGTEILVEVALNPLKRNNRLYVIAAITDITARKRAEEELARSNRDLEHFAYVASHDLQEPLRAVAGCVQLLEKNFASKLDANARELIAHAVGGTSRMQSLIEDLLTYSRVKRQEEELKPVDLNNELDTALKNLETAINESQAQISCDKLPTINTIPAQMVELFQNLVGNAIKFRKPTTPLVIQVRYRMRDNKHLFSVSDNGIGIEKEYYDRVFVIFQRLHTREEYSGTGIGLALCKRIVDQHRGEIWLESDYGEGTTVHFTLPAR